MRRGNHRLYRWLRRLSEQLSYRLGEATFTVAAAWLFSGAVVGRIGSLAATVLVSASLEPKAFGEITLLIAGVAFLAGVAGLGLSVSVSRQVASVRLTDKELAANYAAATVRLTLVVAFAGTTAWLLSRDLLSEHVFDIGSAGLVEAAAPGIVGVALSASCLGGLLGFEEFRFAAAAQSVQGLATGAGLVAGAELGGAAGALLGYSIGTLIAGAVALALLRRCGGISRGLFGIGANHFAGRLSRLEWSQLLEVAGPALAAFAIVSVALLGGQLLLAQRPDGDDQVALFNLAYRWYLVVSFLPAAVAPMLVPILTRLHTERRSTDGVVLMKGTLALGSAVTIAPAAALVLAGPLILSLSGAYYSDHPATLVLLAASAVPTALNAVLSSFCLSRGAVKAWLLSDVALAAALFGTAALAVPGSGASGLALAHLVGLVVSTLFLVRPVLRLMRAASPSSPVS